MYIQDQIKERGTQRVHTTPSPACSSLVAAAGGSWTSSAKAVEPSVPKEAGVVEPGTSSILVVEKSTLGRGRPE